MRSLDLSKEQEATGQSFPEIGFCAEKNRLQKELLDSIHELNSLLTQQTQALIAGDDDFGRFDVLLHLAQEKKDAAKYKLIAHIEAHHCWT